MNREGLARVVIGIGGVLLFIVGSSRVGLAQIRSERSQFWHQNATDVWDILEDGDLFGSSFAVGDFNGDARDDLAIGVRGETVLGVDWAGAVNVLYGNDPGLLAEGNQFWHQNTPGVPGQVEIHDEFGTALAAGDFNHDGYDDLAIGVPGDAVNSISGAGVVHIFNGSAAGLTVNGTQLWNQDVLGSWDAPEPSDRFGSTLAAGDFDRDGYVDLAIGVPREDYGIIINAGVVHVLYGSTSGLAFDRNQHWHQNRDNILEAAESEDLFGAALASGDFNNDGFADLAVGVPSETLPNAENCGLVNVIYGTPTGLHAANNQIWSQATASILDPAEEDDFFGSSLATGDFDLDGCDDLAIGAPGEDIGSISEAGGVNVIYGSPSRLSISGNQFWHQDNGLVDSAEAGDYFGYSLTTGRFGRTSSTDLAIGVLWEDVQTVERAGAVNVIYGTRAGLAVDGTQLWHQWSPGIFNDAGYHDQFGIAIAGGDFDGDGSSDLAIGVPYEDYMGVPGITNGGAIHVLHGCCILFIDGFESGNASGWS